MQHIRGACLSLYMPRKQKKKEGPEGANRSFGDGRLGALNALDRSRFAVRGLGRGNVLRRKQALDESRVRALRNLKLRATSARGTACWRRGRRRQVVLQQSHTFFFFGG
jgi:hypothetical protein